MKIKDMLLPLGLALITTWFIQYFFFMPQTASQAQESVTFTAPELVAQTEPLKKEIDFLDTEKVQESVDTLIETSWARMIFSTHGASLDSLEFVRPRSSDPLLSTIQSSLETAKEERAFLVALDTKTPFYYIFEHKEDLDNEIKLTYAAHTDAGEIVKSFIISKEDPSIKIELTCSPKDGAVMQPRIFFPVPYLKELQDDALSSIVVGSDGKFIKTIRANLSVNQGWNRPTLFGGDDRYYIHALIRDNDAFVKRAYYKFSEKTALFAILEGPSIHKATTIQLQFYCGPKKLAPIKKLDERLANTLDYYGWFAPFATVLISILNWLYEYFHNFGLAIILLTIFIRLLMFPFTIRAEKGMKERAEMQKRLAYIRQKYKNEPDRLAREQAEFMKKHGVSGLGGCLPILIQIPIFMALGRILANAIELYQAPFLWIPDLSSRDPYYILPAIVVLSMVIQMSSSQDAQQRLAGFAMAAIFGAVVSNFSAGLALYIAISTFLGALQTVLLRKYQSKGAA